MFCISDILFEPEAQEKIKVLLFRSYCLREQDI